MTFPTHAFYIPGQTNILDVACQRPDGTWFGGYGKQTEAQLAERGAKLMTFDDACELAEAACRVAYVRPPTRTDAETFNRMLGELPPVGYTSNDGTSFKMCERMSGDLTSIYAFVDGEHWSMCDSIRTPHAEIVRRCRAAK